MAVLTCGAVVSETRAITPSIEGPLDFPLFDESEDTVTGAQNGIKVELPLGAAPWPLPGVIASGSRWGEVALTRVIGSWVLLGSNEVEPGSDASMRELWAIRVWPLNGRVGTEKSIGRSAGADVRVDLPRVSRLHAALRIAEDGILITDAGSCNGTFVDGIRVESPTRVEAGATITIGPISLELIRTDDLLARIRPLMSRTLEA